MIKKVHFVLLNGERYIMEKCPRVLIVNAQSMYKKNATGKRCKAYGADGMQIAFLKCIRIRR